MRIIGIVVVVALLQGVVRAGEPPADYRAAVERYVADLHDLAEWCRKGKLFGLRDEIYEDLLVHAPDDAKARQWLRYKKQDDGTWLQNPKYKRPKNWNRSKLKAYPERRAPIDDTYRDAVLAVLAGCETIPSLRWGIATAAALGAELEDPKPAAVARALRMKLYGTGLEQGDVRAMAEAETALLAASPDDADVRLLLGHARHAGQWVLRETAQARAHRPVVLAAGKEAIEAAGTAVAVELRADEAILGMAGLRAFERPNMRAVGTGKPEDLQRFAAACEAAGPFFAAAVGRAPKRRPQNTAFLFSQKGEVDEFLERHETKDSPLLKMFKELKLHITWIDGRTMLADRNPPDAQLDLGLNMLFTVMLSDTFFGSTNLKGWLDEGISRHLTYLLVGTRLSVGLGGRYGDKQKDDTRHVPESKDAWLKKAHANLAKTERLHLRLTLGKAVDGFTVRDSLLSYAFAVYLLEGRPDAAVPFFEALGQGKDLDVACRAAFGFPVSVLEVRLMRWLAEMTR